MIEARLPCPVCLGATMLKRSVPDRRHIVLDICPRCGGIWFERGEVQAVRAGSALPDPGPGGRAHAGRCPACGAMAHRDEQSCPACGHDIRIDCPACDTRMRPVAHGTTTLDVCLQCRGVWFDHHELAAVWSVALARAAGEHAGSAVAREGAASLDPGTALSDALGAVDLLAYTPDLGVAVVEGSAHAFAAGLEVLGHVPDVAAVVAEAAAAVFELLVEVVAAVLSGLSF